MKRRFLMNQLVGFGMLIGSAFFAIRPSSAAIDPTEIALCCVLFIICGTILVWKQTLGDLKFFILTLPFLWLASIYLTYPFNHATGSFIPGFCMLFLDIVLQYTHAGQEEIRKWMNH